MGLRKLLEEVMAEHVPNLVKDITLTFKKLTDSQRVKPQDIHAKMLPNETPEKLKIKSRNSIN